jgi:hypothetical protein
MPRTALIVAFLFLVVLLGALTPVRPVPVADALAATTAPVRATLTPDPTVITGPPRVKLAVLVVFDQMRGDYITRWRECYPPGGFRRLMDEGAWFSSCLYPYATTTTGPGHAALMTGSTLNYTGIINNEWYDRSSGYQVNCSQVEWSETVSGAGPSPRKSRIDKQKSTKGSSSPDRLLAPGVGDQVKAADRGGKVIGLSIKDRAAIFPSGRHADGAYWMGSEFVTSTYYRDVLPPWVRAFNSSGTAKKWYGKSWDRLRPDLDYVQLAGPDDVTGESKTSGLGRTFPHPITGGKPTLTGSYYGALICSPFGNDILWEFTQAAIAGEKLGQRDAADVLTVSFSSNDIVGHAFGPDSQEVLDITLRSDRLLADLLNHLDAVVGKGNYCVVMSADHGICPLPEVSKARGEAGAKRVDFAGMIVKAEKHLRATYGPPIGAAEWIPAGEEGSTRGNFNQWIEAHPLPWIYLNHRQIDAKGLNRDDVADALAAELRRHPDVERAYSRTQLAAGLAEGDEIDRLVRASDHPARSGDVYVIFREGCLADGPLSTGTNHGSGYHYDRHVPLLVYGPGVVPGEHPEPVTPLHVAPILSRFLGVKPPRDCLYDTPATLFRK